MKYEDDLHNCTPERLAEMLEEQGKIFGEFSYPFLECLLTEAARRLRIPPYQTFHEEYMGEV